MEKKYIVISADYYQNCLMIISAEELKSVTVLEVVDPPVTTRTGMFSALTESIANTHTVFVINNEGLSSYLSSLLDTPVLSVESSVDKQQSIYRLSCCLDEGKFIADKWYAEIEISLNTPETTDHFLACLLFAADRFLGDTPPIDVPIFIGDRIFQRKPLESNIDF